MFWAELGPVRGREQAGRRPVLIVSHEIFNERSETVIAVAITSKPPAAGFPLTLELTSVRLPKPSWAKIGQVRTLSTSRLGRRIGRVSAGEIGRVVEGLNEIIAD